MTRKAASPSGGASVGAARAALLPATAEIRALEAEIADRDDIPDYRKVWGWGGDPETLKRSRTKKSKSGRLCSSCDARYLQPELTGCPHDHQEDHMTHVYCMDCETVIGGDASGCRSCVVTSGAA